MPKESKFIHIFDTKLKDQLIKAGYNLLFESNGFFIFENDNKMNFNFSEAENKDYLFSNIFVV